MMPVGWERAGGCGSTNEARGNGHTGACQHSADPAAGQVRLYPGLGLGMLQREMAAPGRLWLMLRYLDEQGQGVLRVAIIQHKLTTKQQPLRLCGKRQLRNLLRQGEGVFWSRDRERLWLHSAARVAQALGVERLSGHPVALPVRALLDGIGTFRAHLYAAFHSGRRRAAPISRAVQEELTGISGRSQRRYDSQAGVQVQTNVAVAGRYQKEAMQEQAWRRGRAVFEFIDSGGQQGRPNGRYLAWRLPNSYHGPHQQAARGRQRKINRKLKDLVKKRAQGNGSGTGRKPDRTVVRLFHADGAAAGRNFSRHGDTDAYWSRVDGPGRGSAASRRAQRPGMWHLFLRP
jgi:hypothetical protein